jgi:dTDP-4-dehydrorhamnose reductase
MWNELSKRSHTVGMISHQNIQQNHFEAPGRWDWIINCAGITGTPNVDGCEAIKKETVEANAIFPAILYKKAKSVGARYAHFSSGCIYQGEITDVNADPNFFGSIYSVSKGVSDLYLKDKALVFRIRMPFTGKNEPKNFLSKILKYSKTAKLMDGGQNSLTDIDEAVRVACDLIEEGVPNGPHNLVNSGSLNMHELVEILGIENPQWFTAEEFKSVTAASRSNCTIPDTGRMRPIKEALGEASLSLKIT